MRRISIIFFLAIASLPFLLMLLRHNTAREPVVASAPADADHTLVIISPHRREVRLEYSRAFSQWYRLQYDTPADIRWLDVGGTSKIMKELESRFRSNPSAPGVDLLFGGGVAPYLTAADHNWLAPVDLPHGILDNIPPLCAGTPVFDPGGRWFGVTLSGFGILYNRPLVRRLGLPVPATWEDLARPEFFSWVGSGDPRSSGSVHMCYEIILQSYGFEKGWPVIARLCANVRSFGEAGGTVPREVAAGDIAAGMVIDQYAHTVIRAVGDDSLSLVLPVRQTVIGPDAIAVLRGAPHPELAKRFIMFSLSDEGQRLLYQPAGTNGQRHTLFRMPVVRSLYCDPEAPHPDPFTFPAGLVYDNELATRRWTVLNDLIGVWLIDAHDGLRDAWRQVIARGLTPDDVARLCAAPLSEKELEALPRSWDDPRHRHDTMQAWAKDARARYESLLRH